MSEIFFKCIKNSHKTCQHCSLFHKIAPVRSKRCLKTITTAFLKCSMSDLPFPLKTNYCGIKRDFKNHWREGRAFIAVSPCSLLDERNVLLPLAVTASEIRKGWGIGVSYFQCGDLCLQSSLEGTWWWGGASSSPLTLGRQGDTEKPYPSPQYMAAYNPAHPFPELPRGFYCSHWEGFS